MTVEAVLERLAVLQKAGRPALVWGVDRDLSAVGGSDAHRFVGGPEVLLQALKALDAAVVVEERGLWVVGLTEAPPRSLIEVCGLTEDVLLLGEVTGVLGGWGGEVGPSTHPREVLAAPNAPVLLRARALWWLGQLDAAVTALRPLLDAAPGTPERLAGLQEWGRMLGCTDQLSLLSRLQDLSAREYPEDPVLRVLGNPLLDESVAPTTPLSLRVLSVMSTDEATLRASQVVPVNRTAVIAAVAASGNRSLMARVRLVKLGSAVDADQFASALALLPEPNEMTSEEMYYAGVCHLGLGNRDRALRFLKAAMTRYSESLMVMGVYAAAAALAAGLREYGGLLVDRVQNHLAVAPHADALLAQLLVAGAIAVPQDRIRLLLAAGHAFEMADLPQKAAEVRAEARAEGWPIPLGEYDLMGPLGIGGRGRVFRAEHRPSGAHLAIKILHRGIDADELRREATVHARLHHRGVVRALDVGRVGEDAAVVSDLEEEAAWFAMSIAPGVPVSTLAGRLGEVRLARVLRSVLEGLNHCHAREVVHRDIKPENIIVDGEDRVYLIDFGLSSTGRRIAGSPAVMAPEQWAGRADARSDLYGLAVSTVYLVSGVWPYVGGFEAMKRAHLDAPAPEAIPGATPALVRWIHRGMQKAPGDRFQTAAEALAALPDVLLLPGAHPDVAAIDASPDFEDAAQHGVGLVNRETPLVGRDAITEALWQAVENGEGRIELRGPPGVGRTALLHWLRFSIRERGLSVALESGRIRLVDGDAPDGPGLLVCAPGPDTPARGTQLEVPPLSVAGLHDIALHVLALEPGEALRMAVEAQGSPKKLRDLLSGAIQPALPASPPWPSIGALRRLVALPIDDPTQALATMAAGLERMIEEGVPWNDPLWSSVESHRIVCLLNLGQSHEAIAAARAQLDSPNRPGFSGRAWAHLSWSLREIGQPDEALQVAQDGLEQLATLHKPVARCELLLTAALLDPSASYLQEGWELWTSLGYPTQSPDPREIEANRLFEDGDAAGAVAVLDSPPERSNSVSALCGMLLFMGDLGRAERAATRLVELGDPPVMLACVRVAQGRFEEAQSLCLEEHGRWSERERVACLVASRAEDPAAPVEALLPWLGGEFRVVWALAMLEDAANRADGAGLSARASAIRRKLPSGASTGVGSA